MARRRSSRSNLTPGKRGAKAGRRRFLGPHRWPVEKNGKVYAEMDPEEAVPLKLRSKMEANVARLLEAQRLGLVRDNNLPAPMVQWLYEPCLFLFPERKGVRSYRPDFLLILEDGSVQFLEVKGWETAKDRATMKRFRKHHPDLTIRTMDEKSYRAIEKKLSTVVPGWER